MEKAQELAQGSKQDQHIAALAQKAHDISELQNSLGGGKYNSHTQFACSFGGWKRRLKGSFGGWNVVSGIGVGFFWFLFPCLNLGHKPNFITIYLPFKQI